jgi:HSP20 family protein
MSRDLIHLMQSLFPCVQGTREDVWRPAVDVYRTPRGWLLKFDLAGVRPEEVALKVEGCRVTIQGVRRDWLTEEGCSYYRMEIAYNHFERSVELPCDVEPASIATDYRHGMLLVHLITEAQK